MVKEATCSLTPLLMCVTLLQVSNNGRNYGTTVPWSKIQDEIDATTKKLEILHQENNLPVSPNFISHSSNLSYGSLYLFYAWNLC